MPCSSGSGWWRPSATSTASTASAATATTTVSSWGIRLVWSEGPEDG